MPVRRELRLADLATSNVNWRARRWHATKVASSNSQELLPEMGCVSLHRFDLKRCEALPPPQCPGHTNVFSIEFDEGERHSLSSWTDAIVSRCVLANPPAPLAFIAGSFTWSCAAGWRSKEAADVRVKGPKRKLRAFLIFDL